MIADPLFAAAKNLISYFVDKESGSKVRREPERQFKATMTGSNLLMTLSNYDLTVAMGGGLCASLMSDKDRDPGGDDSGGTNTGVVVKTKPKTKKPSMYKVIMLNDDYTPMEFVIYVLERFFSMNREEATRIMLHVHQRGVGVCGVFTYEVAETKVTQVMDFARQNQHPLQCTLEKD